MPRIQILGDQLINRIAAGEVVERPASVVKELVENSLDAGATSLDVVVEAGGRRRIQITDDGQGMDRDDALLSLERHATSKLGRASDLDAIETLGFRGEALSSIAAVSQFTLRTAVDNGQGTEVVVRGGRIQSVRETGLPRGTVILVERLFFNVPARRKFLRSDGTELSHILRWVTRYALAHPEIRFRLMQGSRTLLQATPTGDRGPRIAQILGDDLAAKLLPFSASMPGARLEGFAGRPIEALPRRDAQHLFVNGRAVQDRMLAHAVREAYGNTMPKGRFPSMFLFLEVDAPQVDVNVHPQKTEVRFRQSSPIHDFVRDTVASALSHTNVVPAHGDLRPPLVDSEAPGRVAGAAARYLELRDRGPQSYSASPRPRVEQPSSSGAGMAGTATPLQRQELLEAIHERQESAPRAVALTQFRQSYILAQDEQGLLVLDQHAAHERVLFERYLADAETDSVEVQRLLFPLNVELAPHELALLENETDEFRRLGFVVEPFGGNTVRVDGVPAVAGALDPAVLLRELLGEAGRSRTAVTEVAELRRRLVTSAACQAAIKVNYPLTQGTMQVLVNDLFETDSPSTCPHGRPALFRLTLEEIERAFRRR